MHVSRMPRSTPLQRAAVYKALIELIDNGERFFLCTMLSIPDWDADDLSVFPELWALRPNRSNGMPMQGRDAWYSDDEQGMQKRRNSLSHAYATAIAASSSDQ